MIYEKLISGVKKRRRRERKMAVKVNHLSHSSFGAMSESEIYYAVGDKTHLTRHGNFGFAGNSSWFGFRVAQKPAFSRTPIF